MTLAILYRTPKTVLEIALGTCLLSACFQSRAFGQVRVYPEPQQLEVLDTGFLLDHQAVIVLPLKASENDSSLARFLMTELADRYGLAIKAERFAKLSTDRHAILMGSIANPLVKEYCLQHQIDVTNRLPGPEGSGLFSPCEQGL